METFNCDTVVEIPLNSRYLTDEGMYIAGYLWGRHIRSPQSVPKEAPKDFIRGVEDGYGDGLASFEDRKEAMKEKGRLVAASLRKRRV